MKKYSFALAAFAIAATCFGAFNFNGVRIIPAIPPVSISAGTTNEAVVAVSGMQGGCEVVATASDAAARTALNVTLYTTNAVDGGWTVYTSGTTDAKTDAVVRVTFPGQYMPPHVKVAVGSIGAASTAAALILTH